MTQGIDRRALFPIGAGLAGVALAPVAGAQPRALATSILDAGTHQIMADTRWDEDILVHPGATIAIAAGATLTLNGGLQAPVDRIFTGEGKVDLNQSHIPHAHPEWWGAAPGRGDIDSLGAMRACLAAHPVMHLLPADYYLSDTLVIDRPFTKVRGAGFRGTDGWRGTRLVVTHGQRDVLRVGPATRPASVNDYPQNIDVRHIALCRSVPVDGPATGLTAQFLLYAHFEQLSAAEHGVGYRAHGLVRTQMNDCVAFRSLPGARKGESWRGFVLDGMEDIGLAGGNASLFLRDCNATIGGDPGISDGVGLLMEGAFADSYIQNFEATAVASGIRVDGRSSQIGERARNGHVNLHIAMPIIDQCGDAGIVIRDTSEHMLIDISEPYVAVSASAKAAIHFHRMRGSASITGGQLVGMTNSDAGGDAVGLLASESEGFQTHGLKIMEHDRPLILSACQGFVVNAYVGNPRHRTSRPAALIANSGRGTMALIVTGDKGAFPCGMQIDGTCHRIKIDVTGHDVMALRNGHDGHVRLQERFVPVPSRLGDILIEGV